MLVEIIKMNDNEKPFNEMFDIWADNRLMKYCKEKEDDEEDEDEDELWIDDWEDPNDTEPETHEAIAIRLMDALTENKLDSYIILKDAIIAEWWGEILNGRAKNAEKQRQIDEAKRKSEEDARARAELLRRLTADEKRLLGIK